MRIITGFKNLDMKKVQILSYIQRRFIFRLQRWLLLDMEIYLGPIQLKNMCAFSWWYSVWCSFQLLVDLFLPCWIAWIKLMKKRNINWIFWIRFWEFIKCQKISFPFLNIKFTWNLNIKNVKKLMNFFWCPLKDIGKNYAELFINRYSLKLYSWKESQMNFFHGFVIFLT